LRDIEIERSLVASDAGDGEIAEAAAPLDEVRDGLAIERDLGRDHGEVAVLLEAEDFADAAAAVAELVRDAEVIGIGRLLVPSPVDALGWGFVLEVQREGTIDGGGGVDEFERLAVLTFISRVAELPAFDRCALIGELDAVEAGLDDEVGLD